MQGGIKSHSDCIQTFFEVDYTADLKAIKVEDVNPPSHNHPNLR